MQVALPEREPVFVGIAEFKAGRYPDYSFMEAITDIAMAALADAGIAPSEVDVLLLAPCLHSMEEQADLIFARVVEELGLQGTLKANIMVHSGGSTSDNLARVAGSLIATGEAETVLVLQTDRWGSADVASMIDMLTFNGIPREWERMAGQNFNAIGALLTQRYMHESGATAEEMASICVALREWAQLNPNAMFHGKPLTVDDVMRSRVMCDPIHALECPMMGDGSTAFVMTTKEKARSISDKPLVRMAGSGGSVTHFSLAQESDLGTLGWPKAAREAFGEAGWGVADADFAQIYDSYPVILAIAVEGIGLAPKGMGARYFAEGRFSPGGEMPVNTNGGLLSGGHIAIGGGLALLLEGVRQLSGRAPADRQIPNCRRGIVGGTGGSYSDAQVLLLERID